jgi:hypothetical protein
MHHAQGLTFDHLAFDPFSATNMASHTQHCFIFVHKTFIYIFPIIKQIIHVDSIVQRKMLHFKK